jgi:hypothetical protein
MIAWVVIMANYAVTDVITVRGTVTEVAAALETAIEAVDTGKTLRHIGIYPTAPGNNQFVGVLIHDA